MDYNFGKKFILKNANIYYTLAVYFDKLLRNFNYIRG